MKIFTISNNRGIQVSITNYGGRIMSIHTPDRVGHFEDIVLGYDHLDEYLRSNEKYYGALVGRYANRIGNASCQIEGKTFLFGKNEGENCLHGGKRGFHNVLWQARQLDRQTLELNYYSVDMEEGFPGNLSVKVTYHLSESNELSITYDAETDKITIVNLTHHSFFNLTGNPLNTINNHVLQISADYYTPVDEHLIPTGEIAPVDGTPFDFREPVAIGERLTTDDVQLKFGHGYDHNWVLSQGSKKEQIRFAAKVTDPASGRILEVYTNEPGLQFYGGNFLDGKDKGKGHISYQHRTAFCLETQHFPDSPNHSNFPSVFLRPDEHYSSVCIYRFGN